MSEPEFAPRDRVKVARAISAWTRDGWEEATVLFKIGGERQPLYQVKFDDGRQDAVHVERMQLVANGAARL